MAYMIKITKTLINNRFYGKSLVTGADDGAKNEGYNIRRKC